MSWTSSILRSVPRPVIDPAPRSSFTRSFTSNRAQLSPLFNLTGLSGSRESQFLSRERGIPRTEYSANLQLIRSSEVDPFAPAPGASPQAQRSQSSSSPRPGTPGRSELQSSQSKATASRSATAKVLNNLRPPVVHALAGSAPTDEPLKAQYRIAIENLRNELQDAKRMEQEALKRATNFKETARKARRLSRNIIIVFLAFASYVAIDVGYKMGTRRPDLEYNHPIRQRHDARNSMDEHTISHGLQTASANGTNEITWDATAGEVLQSAASEAKPKGSRWRDWFWASPQPEA